VHQHAATTFKKGYVENWSEELFVVGTRLPTSPVTYKLKDLAGNYIKGTSYTDEFQYVTVRRGTYSKNAEESVYDLQ